MLAVSVYCELSDEIATLLKLSKYITFCVPDGKFNIAYAAERIWQQDESGVIFVKNRNSDPETTPVDMTEFIWVKLQSVPV